jgi:hypothetical protein
MALLNSVNAGSFVSGVLEASAAEGNSYWIYFPVLRFSLLEIQGIGDNIQRHFRSIISKNLTKIGFLIFSYNLVNLFEASLNFVWCWWLIFMDLLVLFFLLLSSYYCSHSPPGSWFAAHLWHCFRRPTEDVRGEADVDADEGPGKTDAREGTRGAESLSFVSSSVLSSVSSSLSSSFLALSSLWCCWRRVVIGPWCLHWRLVCGLVGMLEPGI